jgi:hypothetical protein
VSQIIVNFRNKTSHLLFISLKQNKGNVTDTLTTKNKNIVFDICGSVRHHSITKTTNVMHLVALVFIIPW